MASICLGLNVLSSSGIEPKTMMQGNMVHNTIDYLTPVLVRSAGD